jgi:hypothetical protein
LVLGRRRDGEDAEEAGGDVFGGDVVAKVTAARPASRISVMAVSSSLLV